MRNKAENSQTDYEKVQEIVGQLEEGISNLFNSENYKAWLDTMSRFHTYSLNNTILIAMQRPDASLVAGYSAWKKNFGRHVKKGEKAIRIMAPAPYRQLVEVDRIDPDTHEVEKDQNGDPLKDTVEVTRSAFRVVSVFDISQTEGKELLSIAPDELKGDVEEYETFVDALRIVSPVPISFADISGGAKGYFLPAEQKIVVQKDMSELQTIKTMIHEMAHAKLHGWSPDGREDTLTRSEKEVQAESVAYSVCRHFGLDTSEYSFGYIAGWSSGKEMEELKYSLYTIRDASADMISDINSCRRELEKEKQNLQKPGTEGKKVDLSTMDRLEPAFVGTESLYI